MGTSPRLVCRVVCRPMGTSPRLTRLVRHHPTVSIMRHGCAYIAAIFFLTRGCQSFTFTNSRGTTAGVHHRPKVNKGFSTNSGICLAKKTGNTDDDEKEYTRVEDGSYIGVAIVGIGSLLLLNDGASSPLFVGDDGAWIVFATASLAAGMARLYRYTRDKDS